MGILARLFGKQPVKPGKDMQTATGNEHTSEPDAITFNLENIPLKELSQCHVGEYVNFWFPEGETHNIFVYRRGAVGGYGKLGYVPGKYSKVISDQMVKKLDYETEILEIDTEKLSCKVKCILHSKAETEARHAARLKSDADRLRLELEKPYKPKSHFMIRVQLPKNHNLKEGKELYLEKQPMEFYLQHPVPLQINFLDEKGLIVAKKNNEPQSIRNILRADLSQFHMTFKIESIDTPDKYTLNYLDEVEAKVNVSFD